MAGLLPDDLPAGGRGIIALAATQQHDGGIEHQFWLVH
jgi:hypothetical protein